LSPPQTFPVAGDEAGSQNRNAHRTAGNRQLPRRHREGRDLHGRGRQEEALGVIEVQVELVVTCRGQEVGELAVELEVEDLAVRHGEEVRYVALHHGALRREEEVCGVALEDEDHTGSRREEEVCGVALEDEDDEGLRRQEVRERVALEDEAVERSEEVRELALLEVALLEVALEREQRQEVVRAVGG
jgi:hypothetical protein